jgi:hypothetical protein
MVFFLLNFITVDSPAGASMQCNVRNANYERVIRVIEKYLAGRYANACSCQRCVSDMAAIALNYLPPHYYVESTPDKELGSPWVMVESAVVEAIDRVVEQPNHARQPRVAD